MFLREKKRRTVSSAALWGGDVDTGKGLREGQRKDLALKKERRVVGSAASVANQCESHSKGEELGQGGVELWQTPLLLGEIPKGPTRYRGGIPKETKKAKPAGDGPIRKEGRRVLGIAIRSLTNETKLGLEDRGGAVPTKE